MKMQGKYTEPKYLLFFWKMGGKRHLGGHDLVRRMGRQGEVLIWCRKCSAMRDREWHNVLSSWLREDMEGMEESQKEGRQGDQRRGEQKDEMRRGERRGRNGGCLKKVYQPCFR